MLEDKPVMEQKDMIGLLAGAAQKSDALVVSEIGSQTTWLHETGDDPRYLYLSGPMGMAPSVALGVALANPERPVLGICGDGALAMNFSALVTIASEAPPNLTLALMDNGVYDFTGAVPSPSAAVDWEKLIGGLPGFVHFGVLREEKDAALGEMLAFDATRGTGFIHCPVIAASRKPVKFPYSAPEIHKRYKAFVTGG